MSVGKESKKGKRIFAVVPPQIYDIFVQASRIRNRSISDTVRYFLFTRYDELQKFLEEEKAKYAKKRKKEVTDEGKEEVEDLTG